jgi:hypothetical protein
LEEIVEQIKTLSPKQQDYLVLFCTYLSNPEAFKKQISTLNISGKEFWKIIEDLLQENT